MTVTANAQTIAYGDDADFKGYSITNWAADEEQSDIGAMGVDNEALSGAGKLKVGEEYNFTIGDLSAGNNYTITFNSAAVTVNKLTLTHDVVVTAEKTYDGNTSAASSGGLTNALSGDTVTLSQSFDYNSKDVADANSISATNWSISGADIGNYDLEDFSPIAGTIAKRTVTASLPTLISTKEYDGTNVANYVGGSLSNVITGEDVTLAVEYTYADKNVGDDKLITASTWGLSGDDIANYILTTDKPFDASGSITPRTLTHDISITTVKMYDGTTAANYTGGLLNVVEGDDVILYMSCSYNSANVLEANTINTAWDIGGGDAGNYDFTGAAPAAVSGSITARPITITADNQTKMQGEALPPLTYMLSESLIAGNSVSGMLSVTNSDVPGTHDIEQGTLNIASGNYAITYVNGILTVTAANTINSDNFSQGMNSNFSSTIPAIEGVWLANDVQATPTVIDPYTMNYSELVSLELQTVWARAMVDHSASVQVMTAFSFRSSELDLSPTVEMRGMSIDDPFPQLGKGVIGYTDLVNVGGFASGDEICIDAGTEIDFSLDVVNSPIRALGSLFDDGNANSENLLPEGYDIGFAAEHLQKINAFKSDYEKLLDEMMAGA